MRTMKLVSFLMGMIIIICVIPGFVAGKEPSPEEQYRQRSEKLEREYQKRSKEIEERYKQRRSAIAREWAKREAEIEKKWKEREKKIRQKWNIAHRSTTKEWVEYSGDNDSYFQVDFEKGFIKGASVVPGDLDNALEIGREKLKKQLIKTLEEKDIKDKTILQGQLKDPTGKAVSPEIMKSVIEKLAEDAVSVEKFISRDGRERIKQSIRVDLLPDHLKTRAEKYIPLVKKYSGEYGLPLDLVMAMIETESYFNPKAVSHAGAYGLMQIVPGSGGMGATQEVYGEPRLLTREQLFKPGLNIQMGTAYLKVLRDKYFKKHTSDPEKIRLLSIAGYNCGPGRVQRLIKGKDLNKMPMGELYKLLQRGVPGETKGYLEKVSRKRKRYKELLG